MAKDTKRSRAPDWSPEETVTLAVWKREFSTETGPVMWQKISSKFPDQRRSAKECKNRWDCVVKVYKKIKRYCDKTGKRHWQLDDKELKSLGLAATYRSDWYNIVQEVCEGLAAGTMSNGSNTGSHSDSLPEHTPAMDTQASTMPMPPQASTSESDTASLDDHHNQSSADDAQVLKRPSLIEVSKLSPEEETEHFDEYEQVDTGVVHVTWSAGEYPSLFQQCDPNINIAGGMESNLEENFGVFVIPPWNTNGSNTLDTYMSQHMSTLKISTASKSTSIVLDGTISEQASGRNEIIEELEAHSDLQSVSEKDQQSQPYGLPDEQVDTGIVPRRLERECPSHQQQYGAVNIAGGMGSNLEENFSVFETPPWDSNDSNTMGTYLSSNLKISTVSKSSSKVLDGTISGQASGRNEIIEELEARSDLQSVSEKDQQSQPCALPVIELKVTLCCESCIRKLRRKLEAMNGVEKPVSFDNVNMKVSVTATAAPEDVLKQVQLVKKTAAMWPQQ